MGCSTPMDRHVKGRNAAEQKSRKARKKQEKQSIQEGEVSWRTTQTKKRDEELRGERQGNRTQEIKVTRSKVQCNICFLAHRIPHIKQK